MWEIDLDKITPEQLDCIADHLLAKALGTIPRDSRGAAPD